MNALGNLAKSLVRGTAEKFAAAKCVPEHDIPTVGDPAASDNVISESLRGSVLRTASATGTQYYAVPAAGDVFSRGGTAGAKLEVIDKWGAAAVEKAVSKHQAWHD